MIKIVRAVQTCTACPSQWDAWDEEGNYYYLRYRHGLGTVTQYRTSDWVSVRYQWDESSDVPYHYQNPAYVREVTSFEHGDSLDGFIELEEFCRLAGMELDLKMYTNYGEHLRDGLVERGLTFLLEEDEEKKDDGNSD